MHTPAIRYATFAPEEARRIAIEGHHGVTRYQRQGANRALAAVSELASVITLVDC